MLHHRAFPGALYLPEQERRTVEGLPYGKFLRRRPLSENSYLPWRYNELPQTEATFGVLPMVKSAINSSSSSSSSSVPPLTYRRTSFSTQVKALP